MVVKVDAAHANQQQMALGERDELAAVGEGGQLYSSPLLAGPTTRPSAPMLNDSQ